MSQSLEYGSSDAVTFSITITRNIITQVASNKSSLLLMIQSKTHTHCNYLQRLLKWEVYTKVTQVTSWAALVQRPSEPIK